ncbi:MAG: hypothetical protein Q9225_006716 [Loekoesia sp. 1 TL-2023]
MSHGCTEAVQLLLRAGCSFGLEKSHDIRNVFAYAVRLLHVLPWMPPTSRSHSDHFEIVKIIIEELVLRRRILMSEMINAPMAHQSKIPLPEGDQILDSGTIKAETFLQNVNRMALQLRSILPGVYTVYHCPFLTVNVANELWSAGFWEIDMPDGHNKTPLMVLRPEYLIIKLNDVRNTIEVAFWLYQKGASLHRPHHATLQSDSHDAGTAVPRSQRRAIHFIAEALFSSVVPEIRNSLWGCADIDEEAGTTLKNTLPPRLKPLIDELSLDCRQFLQKIMLDISPDDCLCACSGRGCLPAVNFLKYKDMRETSIILERYKLSETLISELCLHWLFNNVPSEKFPVAVNREIVRLMTFEALGLRHTCCTYDEIRQDFKTVDPDEADEIRDEDHEGIQLLESLLPEFEERLGDGDIRSFLDGYWATRMEEILAAWDNKPVDEAGMREAGVLIHRR